MNSKSTLLWIAACICLLLQSCTAENGNQEDENVKPDASSDGDADTDTDTDCDDDGDCSLCMVCNLDNGLCVNVDLGSDPKNDCTEMSPSTCVNTGACDGNGTCEFFGTETSCDDGLYCNGADHCDGNGSCDHAGDPCTSGDECNNTCNEGTSGAGDCYSPDTTSCTDADPMTLDDQCNGNGVCTGTDYCSNHDCWSILPTNQNKCYSITAEITCTNFPCEFGGGPDFCGQDAQYPDTARSFSVTTVSDDNLVADSLTGLVWQQTFASSQTWQESIDYCDALDYGSHTDWRLPSRNELKSIVDYGISSPAIDTTAFPGTPNSYFGWSSSYENNTNVAWRVNFSRGYVNLDSAMIGHDARCVRSGQSHNTDQDRFHVSGSSDQETVLDRAIELVWAKEYAISRTWKAALAYCEAFNYSGYTDWRLPNVNELESLVDADINNPASTFPDMPISKFWSSSSDVSNADYAWHVNFGYGFVDYYDKMRSYSARCVRSEP